MRTMTSWWCKKAVSPPKAKFSWPAGPRSWGTPPSVESQPARSATTKDQSTRELRPWYAEAS